MKLILTLLTILIYTILPAQNTDTLPPAPKMSPITGVAVFNAFAIYDSTGTQIMEYQRTIKDTIAIQWGVDQTPCSACPGKKLIVRTFLLVGPGYSSLVYGIPENNPDPAWDEVWVTKFGPVFLATDRTGKVTGAMFRQQNGFTVKWSERAN